MTRVIGFLLIPPGVALLLAASIFQAEMTLDESAGKPPATATLTIDRLAKPTLPAVPDQADAGAQVYWLSCLPCHGDVGQGLTAEFRLTYPEEEQYCWERGCHGERPYEDGFTLPPRIPPLIGQGSLRKFPTAANLGGYISAAMPSWKPGSLSEQEVWAVTAFLLRSNGLWDGETLLDDTDAASVEISPPTVAPTVPAASPAAEDLAATSPLRIFGGIALVALAVFLAVRLVRRAGRLQRR